MFFSFTDNRLLLTQSNGLISSGYFKSLPLIHQNLKMIRILFIIAIIFSQYHLVLGQQKISPGIKIKIDSIRIEKNWRTKKAIIQDELGIKVGDSINQGSLDTMMMRLWNIGNFAKVGYELDTLSSNSYLLKVMAKDALTIVPILSFSGNKQDWSLSAGMTDNNFLGRNIRLNVQGTIGTNAKNFNLGITVPRQLMYKNMSVSGNVLYGQGNNYRIENGEKISGVAYTNKQLSGGISNPWHEDFNYKFSPNLGWSVFQHNADSSLVESEAPLAGNYKVNYLSLSVGESVGYIRRMRHQKNGFQASLGIGAGIGLDKNSPFYYSIGAGVDYHKLFNKVVQFSAEYSTGYTSSKIPSLLFYKGASAVKGILTGEISGQSYYAAYVGWHFTYINRDWFAMEQSVYLNWGSGNDNYLDLYKSAPLYGIGTGFYFNIPMIPWLGFRMYFTYSGTNSNWFRFEL